MSNLVLSLDISTSGTGWALFKGSDLYQSGVLKHNSDSYFERGRYMASQLRLIQSRALKKYDCRFSTIAVEKNSVMGPNQQSMLKIGIVTGIILGRLIADNVVFINVSTWRKHWKFSYKDRSKKAMKAQSKEKALEYCGKTVKDDEADAILIGSYYVNQGYLDELETHDYY
ncbi:phage protein [Streptococcus pyogenes]|uniref:hypothetical protein n=1 Tax=Streptococcus pyogenes TaxID=1314 RepID=UPI000E023238|nr:hypothetical protein [Streptococcus pyogenes]SUO69982.1 phage protein [Streptococcus pyogenes]VGQ69229.1 phage protein [Streptococcus pyogenes]VGT99967.1 phage protein [Streptococcus pyogenes]VGV78342.1 phage protein [Streptococcus pyogenes]VHC30228.1 phage protein [Streptococcus pyogenes]